MKRTPILLAVALALVLAACGSEPTTTASPSTTLEPTPAATPSPTEEPTQSPTDEPTDDGSGSGFTGSLADALPEELNGLPRMDIEGMDAFILPMLQQQGIDAEEADFAFASWGEGQEAVIVTAMRMPGMTEAQLQLIGQMMGSTQTDTGTDVEAETVTIGGKDVLRVTPAEEEGEVLIYIVGDAFFTIISESPDLAEELLSQLP